MSLRLLSALLILKRSFFAGIVLHGIMPAVMNGWDVAWQLPGSLLVKGCRCICLMVSLFWQVGAYLEERVNVGVNFILSAEIDHVSKNSRFGFGMAVGE